MESLCLSNTSILRCAYFTRLEYILLIIPTAIEAVFATSLLVTKWGSGRRHLWITAEGWIYFILALIEMLSHILPAARDRADVFKMLDTILAATSVVPILCYILFIFLFTREEFIDILPHRFQAISKFLLVIFIPTIVALNQLASFIGISFTVMITAAGPVTIRFANTKDLTIWTFLTSLTLALFTAYQTINFSFAFYRLVMAVLNQRRIEATSSDEAHPLRGIGWITGGLKLGAIETVIGFAANGFGSAMTRRIMRMLARASLIIGLLRGLDSSEDFSHLEEELAGAMRFRRSRLRQFISNPRYSTFRQLTPTTTAFHSTPHAPHGLASSPPGRPLSGISATEKFSGVDGTLSTDKNSMVKWPAARRERVTVRFEGGAPSLHMRFSALEISDLPISLFDLPVNLIKDSQPPTLQSAIVPLHVQSSQSLLPSNVMDIHEPLTKQSENLPMINHITALQSPSTVYYPPTKMKRMQSAHSVWNTMDSYTSLSTVRDVASQFPPLPDRVLKPMGCSPPDKRAPDFWDNTTSVLSQTSIIKPRHLGLDLTGTANTSNLEALEATIVNVGERSMDPNTQTNPLKSAITTPATALSNYMPVPATPVAQSVMTAQTEDPYMDFGPALNSGKSRAFVRESSGLSPAADWIDYNAIPGPPLPLVTEESERLARIGHRRSRKSGSMGTLRISWIKNPDMEEAQLTRAVSLKSHIARIKSVGKAPIRSTPRPTRTTHTRGSLHIEHIQIPKKEFSNVEIIQGSFESAYDCSILRDSDVLGNEDFTNKLQV